MSRPPTIDSSSASRTATATRAGQLILAGVVLTTLCIGVRLPWAGRVGFKGDMMFFQRWAATAAELRASDDGVGKIYRRQRDCNYPPLYIIVLSYLPSIDTWWRGEKGWEIPVVIRGKRRATAQFRTRTRLASLAPVLKLPPIVADILLVLLVLVWVWKRSDPRRAVLAAALWALNPLAIFNGSYFGQVDSVHALWMVAALLAALDHRVVLAWCMVTLALLTKLQSIVIVPVIVLLSAQPMLNALSQRDRATFWRGLRRLLLATVAVAAVVWMILAPFARAGTLREVKRVYVESVSDSLHARVSVSAYNVWWLLVPPQPRRSPRLSDKRSLVGPITARHIGFALFALLTGVACLAALWGGGRCSAMLAAPVIALAFYLVSTQMKARYGFASAALMLPLVICGYRYAVVLGLSSLVFLVNCCRVLLLPDGFFGLTSIINPLARLSWTGHVVAAINVCILAYLFVELFRCARHERQRCGQPASTAQCGA